MKAKPMPATAEDLAELLVDRVRHYERSCRCPRCHGQIVPGPVPRLRETPASDSGPLACVDCPFCLANLRKLMLAELTTNPAAAFFPCVEQGSSATILSMKSASTTGKATKIKAKKARTVKAKTQTKTMKKAATPRSLKKRAMKKPAAKITGISKPKSTLGLMPKSGDSDRGLYVRFDSREVKDTVKKAADAAGCSMNAFIAAAALDWVKEGKAPAEPEKKEAVSA